MKKMTFYSGSADRSDSCFGYGNSMSYGNDVASSTVYTDLKKMPNAISLFFKSEMALGIFFLIFWFFIKIGRAILEF